MSFAEEFSNNLSGFGPGQFEILEKLLNIKIHQNLDVDSFMTACKRLSRNLSDLDEVQISSLSNKIIPSLQQRYTPDAMMEIIINLKNYFLNEEYCKKFRNALCETLKYSIVQNENPDKAIKEEIDPTLFTKFPHLFIEN